MKKSIPIPTKRRTQRDIFIDELSKLSNNGQKLISNNILKNSLRWSDDKYSRIKDQLINEDAILIGRGQGGSVGLANIPGSKALNVFISYSHIDEELKIEITKHLEPLKKLNLIETWHDRKLTPGEEWAKSISKNLQSADIILLLVSIDFINSKYCYDIELEKALELHQQQKATVIPIILRSCLWQHTPFAKLQALPRDGKSLKSFEDIDYALTTISDGLRIAAEKIISQK